MKKIIQPLIIALSSLVFLASCNKEESREIFLGGKVPVLAASVTGSIPLAFATENNPAVRFNWTNPEDRKSVV